jgi:hypothetical protein
VGGGGGERKQEESRFTAVRRNNKCECIGMMSDVLARGGHEKKRLCRSNCLKRGMLLEMCLVDTVHAGGTMAAKTPSHVNSEKTHSKR